MASWRKYPNPDRPDILSVDIIDRKFDPETGVLTATRLVTSDPRLPSWLTPFWSKCVLYCVEESIVDPRKQTMTLRSRNITGSSVLELEEVCTYHPSPENGETTLFRQDVNISSHLFGLSDKMESWSMENFKKNALKGRVIMEDAVLRIRKEAEEMVEGAVVRIKKEAEEIVETNFSSSMSDDLPPSVNPIKKEP
eukprot:CAMPEP_0201475238 /NCGR_PEP_ID=MMETSP0151_2-20130828/691_1 /ASSEMBLY_ACC=CAM_ASM_000257 /TAXON_ID=200890 /ORGANISM="Paramoeba atlantica, Strain 621/1 / CCAP 1560/9" /LENGTH=194 /DNA_ID=CAMNT_0047855277 /DNA_START=172 /DNA_END=756 /DNA_ORIENTATION=-